MRSGAQHIQIDSQGRETVPAVVARRGNPEPVLNGPGASFPFTAPSVSQAAVNAGCSVFLPQAEQPAPTFLGFSEVTNGHAPVQVRLVGLSRSFGVNRPTCLHHGKARRPQPHFIPSHSPMPSTDRPASRCEATMLPNLKVVTQIEEA